MSAEMNARAEETRTAEETRLIIQGLINRVEFLEFELSKLPTTQGRERQWVSFNAVINLAEGDIVRLRSKQEPYQVTRVYDDHASVIRVHEVTNPPEWEVLR